jgi:hypothetical protein
MSVSKGDAETSAHFPTSVGAQALSEGEILTLKQVADFLKVTERTIYQAGRGQEDPRVQGRWNVAVLQGGDQSMDSTAANRRQSR